MDHKMFERSQDFRYRIVRRQCARAITCSKGVVGLFVNMAKIITYELEKPIFDL